MRDVEAGASAAETAVARRQTELDDLRRAANGAHPAVRLALQKEIATEPAAGAAPGGYLVFSFLRLVRLPQTAGVQGDDEEVRRCV